MQCKDIPTLPILEFLDKFGGIGCNWFEYDEAAEKKYSNWRSVRVVMPAGAPSKLVHAKMLLLIKKGLVEGCDCGCRGDFSLTEKGEMIVELARKVAEKINNTHKHFWLAAPVRLRDGRILIVDRCECGLERETSLMRKMCIKPVTGGFLIPESFASTFPGGKVELEKWLTEGDPTLVVEYYGGG